MTTHRAEILESACELYVQDGLEGFSMRKLAKRLGVTAPALYRHFDSREKLVIEVLGEAYRLFAEYLYRALQGATPGQRLELARAEYLDFALEHPRMYEALYVSPDLVGVATGCEEIHDRGCSIGQFWVDRVRECIEDGILRPGIPQDIATTMWAHSHGLLSLWNRGLLPGEESDFRQFFHQSCNRVFAGVGSADTQAPSVPGTPVTASDPVPWQSTRSE
jgi:AcrR family transcriptional regulator